MQQPSEEISQLLQAWSNGDERALDRLIPIVYEELRHLAHSYMARQQGNQALQTTELVNEAYLKLIKVKQMRRQNRAHFFGLSSQVMRRILVDIARSRASQKRGGQAREVSISQAVNLTPKPTYNVLEVNDALEALARLDERKAKIVEIRFFGGLSVAETAEVMKVSQETVMRDWRMAKLWLMKELTQE